MKTTHPHAAAVSRLGNQRIMDHFHITRQAVSYWKRNGVPRRHMKTVQMLGAMHGVQLPELDQ